MTFKFDPSLYAGHDVYARRRAILRDDAPSILAHAVALEAENKRLREALKSILFRRPGGPCNNKVITDMESIARALQGDVG